MLFGLSGHVHDPQNQLFLTPETQNGFNNTRNPQFILGNISLGNLKMSNTVFRFRFLEGGIHAPTCLELWNIKSLKFRKVNNWSFGTLKFWTFEFPRIPIPTPASAPAPDLGGDARQRKGMEGENGGYYFKKQLTYCKILLNNLIPSNTIGCHPVLACNM